MKTNQSQSCTRSGDYRKQKRVLYLLFTQDIHFSICLGNLEDLSRKILVPLVQILIPCISEIKGSGQLTALEFLGVLKKNKQEIANRTQNLWYILRAFFFQMTVFNTRGRNYKATELTYLPVNNVMQL